MACNPASRRPVGLEPNAFREIQMAIKHYDETPEHLWEGKGPSRNGDGSHRRDSTPSEVVWLRGVGQALAASSISRSQNSP